MIAPVGTTVTQGTSTGTLKQAIGKPIYAGYTSGIVIHTKEGVVFTDAADVVVGADTIPAANIQTATGATEPPTATTCLPFRKSTCISTSGTNLNCAKLVNPTQVTCAAASADISGTCFANDSVFKLNGDNLEANECVFKSSICSGMTGENACDSSETSNCVSCPLGKSTFDRFEYVGNVNDCTVCSSGRHYLNPQKSEGKSEIPIWENGNCATCPLSTYYKTLAALRKVVVGI
jgi:hypothetical protein